MDPMLYFTIAQYGVYGIVWALLTIAIWLVIGLISIYVIVYMIKMFQKKFLNIKSKKPQDRFPERWFPKSEMME